MIKIPDFVYPRDAAGNPVCPRCQKSIQACDCPSAEPSKPKAAKIIPKIRLDKSGRRGKCVTLIEALPLSEAYLKDLAKQLKVKSGSGGTFYTDDNGGVVELQGDHLEMVKKFFDGTQK